LPANVLILPLLAGYLFLTYWNFTKFNTKRNSGHRLIFHAAAWGLFFLFVALLVTITLEGACPPLEKWWKDHISFEYAGTSVIAFLLGSTIWWPLNKFFFAEDDAAQRTIEKWNDFLEILLSRAGRETKLVSVTLKSRKVYVGLVTRTMDPMYDRKYIQLLPVKSGYRDATTFKMSLTVDYAAVYAKIIRQDLETIKAGVGDFEIIIPVSEIQSVNLFNPTAYVTFNPGTASEKIV